MIAAAKLHQEHQDAEFIAMQGREIQRLTKRLDGQHELLAREPRLLDQSRKISWLMDARNVHRGGNFLSREVRDLPLQFLSPISYRGAPPAPHRRGPGSENARYANPTGR